MLASPMRAPSLAGTTLAASALLTSFAASLAACRGSDLPPNVAFSSYSGGGMPNSGGSEVVINRDGTSSCTQVGAGPGAPRATAQSTLSPETLEAARRGLDACDVCSTIKDDRTQIPDAATFFIAINMPGISCKVNMTTESWPEPRASACAKALGILNEAACAKTAKLLTAAADSGAPLSTAPRR